MSLHWSKPGSEPGKVVCLLAVHTTARIAAEVYTKSEETRCRIGSFALQAGLRPLSSSGYRSMDSLDDLRAKLVDVIGHLEGAIDAAMPGQAPSSSSNDIRDAVLRTRGSITQAMRALNEIEDKLDALRK